MIVLFFLTYDFFLYIILTRPLNNQTFYTSIGKNIWKLKIISDKPQGAVWAWEVSLVIYTIQKYYPKNTSDNSPALAIVCF